MSTSSSFLLAQEDANVRDLQRRIHLNVEKEIAQKKLEVQRVKPNARREREAIEKLKEDALTGTGRPQGSLPGFGFGIGVAAPPD